MPGHTELTRLTTVYSPYKLTPPHRLKCPLRLHAAHAESVPGFPTNDIAIARNKSRGCTDVVGPRPAWGLIPSWRGGQQDFWGGTYSHRVY